MKKLIIVLIPVLSLLLIVIVVLGSLFSMGEQDSGIGEMSNLSAEVLAHKPMVEAYAKEYGIEEYVMYLLAIMQVESGGKGNDVMQSSESLGLAPNTLELEASIEQGCKYFSDLLASGKSKGCDMAAIVQAYNFGGGFLDFVAANGAAYSYDLSVTFAKNKSGGVKINYSNPIAVSMNGGWRYRYGNQFYWLLVSQYLLVAPSGEIAETVMNEMVKYQGYPYTFGGIPPKAFDCSSLTQWCYGVAGVKLPRTAQGQYDVVQHISIADAQPGDLVFFHSTYNTPNYVTHVGIYVGNNKMFHAGNPIGYADLTTRYWQAHMIGAGRVVTQ